MPTSLREMFSGSKKYGESLINFNYSLVDVKGYDDDSVKGFQSRLLKVMLMLEKAESLKELHEVSKKYKDDISQFDEEEVRIIDVAIDILRSQYKTEETTVPGSEQTDGIAERVSGVFEILLANEKKRERQLISQVRNQVQEEEKILREQEVKQEKKLREQEKIETAKTLLEMGISVEQVVIATKLPKDKVEKLSAGLVMQPE